VATRSDLRRSASRDRRGGLIGLLALAPRPLGAHGGVAAIQHDGGHLRPEALFDVRGGGVGVLDGVMQEAGDGVVLLAAVLRQQRGHGEQVRQVRDPRPFAYLRPVQLHGPRHSFGVPLGRRGGHDKPWCHRRPTMRRHGPTPGNSHVDLDVVGPTGGHEVPPCGTEPGRQCTPATECHHVRWVRR